MRVIAGKYKGLSLSLSKDPRTRPTKDRVKEAVFSVLQSSISNSRFLDLCCGTGAMSIEALSRGAQSVTAVDVDIRHIASNLKRLELEDQSKITLLKRPLERFLLKTESQFDIIYLDPPWTIDRLYLDSLKLISDFDILAQGGTLLLEFSKKNNIPFNKYNYFPKLYQYGETIIGRIDHD